MNRAERHQLGAVVEEVRAWINVARAARQLAAHMPISGVVALSPHDDAFIAFIERMVPDGLLDDARRLTKAAWFDGRKSLQSAHEAAGQVTALHRSFKASDGDARLAALWGELVARAVNEREDLRRILTDAAQSLSRARQMRQKAAHLPLTRTRYGALTYDEAATALSMIQFIGAHQKKAAILLSASPCGTRGCAEAHASAQALAGYHAEATQAGLFDRIDRAATRVSAQLSSELERLPGIYTDLAGWRSAAHQALADAEHLPLTQTGAISEHEIGIISELLSVSSANTEVARSFNPSLCATGACAGLHEPVAALGDYHAKATSSGVGDQITAAAQRVSAQSLRERHQVAKLHAIVSSWPDRIKTILQSRADAVSFLEARAGQLAADSVGLQIGRVRMRLVPLRELDFLLVPKLVLLRDRRLLKEDRRFLDDTATTAASALSAVSAGFTREWRCRSDGKCKDAHSLLPVVYERADVIEKELDRLAGDIADMPFDLGPLADPSLRFTDWLPGNLDHPAWLETAVTARARQSLTAILNAANVARDAAVAAHASAERVHGEDVAAALKAMDLDTLRKASPQEKFRVAPLEAYGVRNVWDVLRFEEKYILASVPGLGESSAKAIVQAALRLQSAVRDDTPVRIDVKNKSELTTALLQALRRWDATRKFKPTADEVALAQALTTLFESNAKVDRVLCMTDGQVSEPPRSLDDILRDVLDRVAPPPLQDIDIWEDFLSRPADYFGMLTELGFTTEDEKKMHGDLPEEIIRAVRARELRRDHLTASLRTYQRFAVQFALTQEKVVIGDEMGLGKTVEALAVLAHLKATRHDYFLVVCPAAVVSNWVHETARHTKLTANMLHGPLRDRNYAAQCWIRRGGVAVTTYDLLPWALEYINQVEVVCAIFDEAHYIKNPDAKRSHAAAEVINSVKHAMLMTGTPLENSVREFKNLIGYIRSDLAESAPDFLPSLFRKHVAPAYLRRNQEDVLTELPEAIEINEWLGRSPSEQRAYRDIVQKGDVSDRSLFANMRRVAMLSEHSRKVERLLQIVEEAKANGHKVLVFSYFLDVLDRVKDVLQGDVFGPLTGATTNRQSLVDAFSAAAPGAVLVAQIKAGGQGLNIQTASVVVICEPQLTPTLEAQAIARAHRMGQKHTVQVYRLLTEDSVDKRIRELVADKQRLFDAFARDSVIAEQAPEAIDISETEIARKVVAAERERLADQTQDDQDEDDGDQ